MKEDLVKQNRMLLFGLIVLVIILLSNVFGESDLEKCMRKIDPKGVLNDDFVRSGCMMKLGR